MFSDIPLSLLDVIDPSTLDDIGGSQDLRQATWSHIRLANSSDDIGGVLIRGMDILASFEFEPGTRLSMTRDALLRLLEQRQRKYREILDRNAEEVISLDDIVEEELTN
jgi:hypothetical protein